MDANPKQSPRHEEDPLTSWRQRTLGAAGFDQNLARRVASDHAFDLHALLELVDHGCPPQLSVRILAPLHWEDA